MTSQCLPYPLVAVGVSWQKKNNVKKQQENKKKSFPDPSQLWKLDGHTLKKKKSKENIWVSNDKWNFKTKDEFILIRNFSKKKVLESTNDGKVSLENFDANGELVKNVNKQPTIF